MMNTDYHNRFAGSDTTSIGLKAIFYLLVKNPHVYKKLLTEIDEADRKGFLSPVISFQQAQDLKYLCVLPATSWLLLQWTDVVQTSSYQRSHEVASGCCYATGTHCTSGRS